MLLLAALLAAASPAADARTPAVVHQVMREAGGIDRSARLSVAYADVGGDAREEAIVYLADRGHCGSGGCALVVLTPTGKGWRAIAKTSVTRLPVYRLLTRRGGWNDLAVGVGGGGAESGVALLRFGNGRYPSNPTVQPQLNRLPYGARLLLDDSGKALVPVREPR